MRFILLLCFACSAASAQLPGARDLSFGAGGRSLSGYDISSRGVDIVRLSSGKYLVLAFTVGESGDVKATHLARYTAAGLLDPGFGVGGSVPVAIPGKALTPISLAITPDERILIGGAAYDSATSARDFFVLRCTASGALDPTFGTAGVTYTDFGGTQDRVAAMALAPDGKIVLSGQEASTTSLSYGAAVARYNPDGSPDLSFGTGGKWWLRGVSLLTSSGAKGIVGPDGRITLAVSWPPGANQDQGLIRLTAGGVLDSSFDSDGLLRMNLAEWELPTDLALDASGRILLTGTDWSVDSFGGYNRRQLFITRYDSAGAVDATFGAGGDLHYQYATLGTQPHKLRLDEGGNLVVCALAEEAGGLLTQFLIAFDSSGVLIPSFGTAGTVAEEGVIGNSFLLQPDGKIVTVGLTYTGGSADSVALHRYGGVPAAAIGSAASRIGSHPQIFPNPSTGAINFGGNLQGYSAYEIRTAAGQVVWAGRLAGAGPQRAALPEGLPAGTYMVVLSGKERSTALPLLLVPAR